MLSTGDQVPGGGFGTGRVDHCFDDPTTGRRMAVVHFDSPPGIKRNERGQIGLYPVQIIPADGENG